MGVFNHPEFDRHESLHYVQDPMTGLMAIIAIHSTALGPAAGGCRRWQYVNDEEALTDALRLSRGMTYKNAIAALPFGGGKAVILASELAPKSPALFRSFGRAVAALDGRYITAEDVGVSVDDMRIVQQETQYVSGLPQSGDSAGGDPSPWTALGVYLAIKSAAKAKLGADDLKGIRVAVQGVGHVGLHLCRLLHQAGAKLIVADVNSDNLRQASDEFPVTVLPPADLLYADVEVLAPCALGNILTSVTIPKLRASVVAGAANNQLATEIDGTRLTDRGILYAPDYVINSGGIISVAREYLGQSCEDEVRAEIERIPERLEAIVKEAEESGEPTNLVADKLARRIVLSGKPDPSATKQETNRRIA
jgi:leucine dehydrogenase